ncbi:MAG: hypothetical protein WA354_06895 [Terracidiphilus sp.]
MHWTRLILVVVGAGIVTSMTDWFFAGDWIHRRWTYPEIWRKGSENRAIAVSSALPFVTCGAFVYMAAWLGVTSLGGALKLAMLVWIAGPLPLILTNAAFIKLHRVFVMCYSAGWLVKLCIAAVAANLALR